ncbi:transglutaminaseTgpA domain-containing protein, partial [Streptomyces sp. URMC 123]|uniref:transglutaminase family protein n=1 Tax=Streptomyces sp. URMC 123 TaxID=3423403 RepID=UPI003F19A051
MSGSARLTMGAALATLLAACSLLPLVSPPGWLVQAAALLLAVSGTGTLARRVPLPRPLTVLAQAAVALLLLTLLFTRQHALLGLLPGPEAFREFGLLLSEGRADVGRYAIPAPVTPGIRLLLVGGVVAIGLTVDALAVTYRSAAPAGLPLLALYSVAAGLSQGGARWLWFLLAAAGYLLLLLTEGRDRLSQWGRIFTAAPPAAPSRLGAGLESGRPATLSPVRTGRRIGALALGIALVVPVALPSLGGGLFGRPGTGEGAGTGGGTISAVNPLVSLQNSLNQPQSREVLRYRSNVDVPQDLYLRIVALDQFDGTTWKPSERRVSDVPVPLPRPQGLGPDVRTVTVTSSVSAADDYAQNWLPLPYPASAVSLPGRWRFEPEGRTLVGDRGQTTRGLRYEVVSTMARPTVAQLSSAPAPPPALLEEYTRVPDSLPGVVAATARQVTAGAANGYERAVRLQDWFSSTGGFTYDTEVATGTGPDAIARFLRQKEGFCVHFSFAMAAMARTLKIPARVAVGFTPGVAQTDGSMSVGLRDAHAWPELYFEGVGWTRFEPTPTRGSAPEYTVARAPEGGATAPDLPRPGASAAPEPAPSAASSCPPGEQRLQGCAAAVPQAGGGSGDDGLSAAPVLGTAALVLLVLLLPVLPLLWRTRVRARRLGGRGGGAFRVFRGGGGPGGPERPGSGGGPDGNGGRVGVDGTLAAWRELIDSGWDYGIVPDDSQTPRQAASRIASAARLDEAAAAAAHRVADAVEQALYAPRPRAAAGVVDDVRRVREGLHASAGRGARLRALLAPRSATRLRWAVSRQYAAFATRWAPPRRLWP